MQDDLEIVFDTGANGRFTVKSEDMVARVGEGSVLKLDGNTRKLEASATTGGVLKAGDLVTRVVNVRANTGGQATVHCTEHLEAAASLGGTVNYYGDPEKIKSNESLGGSVN